MAPDGSSLMSAEKTRAAIGPVSTPIWQRHRENVNAAHKLFGNLKRQERGHGAASSTPPLLPIYLLSSFFVPFFMIGVCYARIQNTRRITW
jgi:hypothetical protein